jgi:hypothetical protein
MSGAEDETRTADVIQLWGAASQARSVPGSIESDRRRPVRKGWESFVSGKVFTLRDRGTFSVLLAICGSSD